MPMTRTIASFTTLALIAAISAAHAEVKPETPHVPTPVPERADCVLIPGDAYDPGRAMFTGPYKGECLDTTRKRAAILIEQSSSMIKVANFRHKNRWWIAEIPRDGVDRLIYQMRKFDSGVPLLVAAHSQLRFVMKKGAEVKLTPQNSSEGPEDVAYVDDFGYSVEYIAPAGVQYGIISGQKEHFAMVPRIYSTDELLFEKFGDPRIIMLQIQITDLPGLANAVMNQAVLKSAEMALDHAYTTLTQNCTTEAFDRIDEALELVTGKRPKPFKIKLHQARDAVVKPSLKGLKQRGLMDEHSDIPTLNEEAVKRGIMPKEFLTDNVTELENKKDRKKPLLGS